MLLSATLAYMSSSSDKALENAAKAIQMREEARKLDPKDKAKAAEEKPGAASTSTPAEGEQAAPVEGASTPEAAEPSAPSARAKRSRRQRLPPRSARACTSSALRRASRAAHERARRSCSHLADSTAMRTILLLLASNVFMTAAWYGHLRHRELSLWPAILISWGIAFFEYCLQVPANRIGYALGLQRRRAEDDPRGDHADRVRGLRAVLFARDHALERQSSASC